MSERKGYKPTPAHIVGWVLLAALVAVIVMALVSSTNSSNSSGNMSGSVHNDVDGLSGSVKKVFSSGSG